MKCLNVVIAWGERVNYIDDNERSVGFDMSSSCCECFGHGVFLAVPTNEGDSVELDLTPYSFVDEPPVDCLLDRDLSGGGLAWRITAPGLPDAYVVIWNHHNGYYSHGFTSFNEDGYL